MSDDDENATPDTGDGNAVQGGNAAQGGEGDDRPPPPQEEPVYNDRSKLDFDPDEGLFTGTAVDGGTDIPGPHENVDDVDPDDTESDDSDVDGKQSS
jgi:hypothetical protein